MGNPINLLLNILWLVFGGLVMAVGWLIASVLIAITIVGLPWFPASLRIAGYTFWPFGQMVVDQDRGALPLIGNIIWFILAGWWLALAHILIAVPLAISIVGIPFAWAHVKLAGLSLAPVGKIVVPAGT